MPTYFQLKPNQIKQKLLLFTGLLAYAPTRRKRKQSKNKAVIHREIQQADLYIGDFADHLFS
jgi:hypothetical protein